jgi:hypothetical protein
MMFPSLSRVSGPLLGADRPTASSGPPRDQWCRVHQVVPKGTGPPGVIRIRVPTTVAATLHLQPDRRGTAMSSAATLPVASRRPSQFVRHHPKSVQDPSHSPRLNQVDSPRRRASGLIGLETGPRIHRRSLPGHMAHHHSGRKVRRPERWQGQLRSHRRGAAGSVDAPRGCGAQRNDLQRRHRRSAASKGSDQELGEVRTGRSDIAKGKDLAPERKQVRAAIARNAPGIPKGAHLRVGDGVAR